MRKGLGWRIPLTVALGIAAGVNCGGDTVFAGGCSSYPMQIVLPGVPGLDALTLRVALEVGAAQDLLLVIADVQQEGCGVPPGNRFVWTTLDPTVASVYATGDSTARVRAVSAGETVVHVRAEPDTTYRAGRGVTVR